MNLTGEKLEHAKRMVTHMEAARRERIGGLLDGAAAAGECMKAALRGALALARDDEGRTRLEGMIATLDALCDDPRAAHSSGEMCAAYEAEVGS